MASEYAVDETVELGEPPPEPPMWYRDIWPWLLFLGVLVLGALVAYLVWRAVDDGEDRATRTVVVAPVPDVIGLPERVAIERVRAAGFEVEIDREVARVPKGVVVDQDPDAGERLRRGGVVEISVSQGPAVVTETTTETETTTQTQTATQTETATQTVTQERRTVEMPSVVGLNHVEAGAAVEEAGLAPNTYPVPSEEPLGTVVDQNPEPGTPVPEGEQVRLNVSLGPDERPLAAVPDVTGPPAAQALARLREANFTVRTVERDAPTEEEVGEVLLQRPAPGTRVPVLTQVTIYVGR